MYSKLHDKQAVQFVGIESEVGQSIIATFQDDLQQMDTVYFVDGISVRQSLLLSFFVLDDAISIPFNGFFMWLCPKVFEMWRMTL